MDLSKLLPIETLLPLRMQYKSFAIHVFNFLNGKINPPYNICNLFISSYDRNNFAEFRKPNIVVLYLDSIICSFYPNELNIKSTILMTLAHELSHSCQDTDMTRYGTDPYYKEMIENSNEANTEKWVIDHMDEIYNEFGFAIQFPQNIIDTMNKNIKNYTLTDGKSFYIYSIIDILYRKAIFIKPIEDVFDKYQNIFICINDGEKIWIKYRGEYILESSTISKFGEVMGYCRRGIALGAFAIVMKMRDLKSVKIGNGDVYFDAGSSVLLNFEITNFRYAPIIGVETIEELDNMRRNNEL